MNICVFSCLLIVICQANILLSRKHLLDLFRLRLLQRREGFLAKHTDTSRETDMKLIMSLLLRKYTIIKSALAARAAQYYSTSATQLNLTSFEQNFVKQMSVLRQRAFLMCVCIEEVIINCLITKHYIVHKQAFHFKNHTLLTIISTKL